LAPLRKVGSLREARAAFHALLEMSPSHSDGLRLLGDTERALEESEGPEGNDGELGDGDDTRGRATTGVEGAASALVSDVARFFGGGDGWGEAQDAKKKDGKSKDSKDSTDTKALAALPEKSEWIRMASRTRPGSVFYYNAKTVRRLLYSNAQRDVSAMLRSF